MSTSSSPSSPKAVGQQADSRGVWMIRSYDVASLLARFLPGLLLLTGLLTASPRAVHADGPFDSPYFGEQMLADGSPIVNGGEYCPDCPPGGPGTLSVSGLGGGPNSADLDPFFEVPGGGTGIMGRIGHIAGKTIGRDESLTHIDLSPYTFLGQNMFFGDFRLYRLNEGGHGGNIGLGWRRYFEQQDVIFGAIGYYDVDDTRQAEFQQMGLSTELLTRWLDVRANWYIPIGDTEQILGTEFVSGSQRFEANQLLFDTITRFGTAAEGVDVTFTSPIPWDKLAPYHVEASAGFYNYQARDTKLDKLWGYRLRLDASFFDRILHTFVDLTSDRQHEHSIVFGASLDYYSGFQTKDRLTDRQYYRMSEWVRRNYNVVSIEDSVVNVGVPVINPTTNAPYFFAHVANNPTVGAAIGTVTDPFDTILTAFAGEPGADVYYVHGGSTFDGAEATLPLVDDKILLGEGVPQILDAQGFGSVTLPVVRPGIVTLSNSAGSTITAGNNNLVGGFTIINPGINGVNVVGRTDGLFRDLDIFGANGDAVFMQNPTGTFRFDRVTAVAADGIDGAGGVAFHVDGGSASTTVSDPLSDILTDPTFQNGGGNINEVILIENTAGGFVNMAATTAVDDGGAGVRVIDNFGSVTLGQLQLTDTVAGADGVAAGLEIRNDAGNVTLLGDVLIDNAAGTGFLVTDIPASGVIVGSAAIAVNNRNGVGADFDNISGQVRFTPSGSLAIGTLNAATASVTPGVRFINSSGSVTLNNVSVADSLAEGILIGDPAGVNVNTLTAQFLTMGATAVSNTAGTGIRIVGSAATPEASRVDFQDTVSISNRLARGIEIVNTSGSNNFSGLTTVNNENGVGFSGLFITNVTGAAAFGSFTTNDNILVESAVDIQNVPGGVSFDSLTVANAQGVGTALPVAGLLVDNVNNFTTLDGAINVLDETAVNIEDTNYQVVFTSVDSINPTITPEVGIRLVRDVGRFEITGDGANLSSGGTISGIANGTNLGFVGLFADDADQVTIRLQDYIGNGRGLVFQNMNTTIDQGFTLDQVQVQDSIGEGVLAIDVRNILIEDSFFQNNGIVDLVPGTGVRHSDTISLLVTEIPDDPDNAFDQDNPEDFPYTYTIQRNQFLDTNGLLGADAVGIDTTSGAASGARLDLFFLDNTFTLFDRARNTTGGLSDRAALLAVSWDGIINADVRRNLGTLGDGIGQTGFEISQASPDDPFASRINMTDNVLTFGDGPLNRGADFVFVGPVQMTIDGNTFAMTAGDLNSNGLRFRLLGTNNLIDITNNIFTFGGGGTGVDVQIVSTPSSFFIEGNQIGAAGALATRGFRFGTINGTLNLFGTQPNFVNLNNANPNNLLSIGSGAVNGQININGIFGP